MCKEMLQSTSELGEDAMINRMCSGNGTTVVYVRINSNFWRIIFTIARKYSKKTLSALKTLTLPLRFKKKNYVLVGTKAQNPFWRWVYASFRNRVQQRKLVGALSLHLLNVIFRHRVAFKQINRIQTDVFDDAFVILLKLESNQLPKIGATSWKASLLS